MLSFTIFLFIPVNPSTAWTMLFSREERMYNNAENNEEGSKSLLTPRAHSTIHNLSQAYPRQMSRWTVKRPQFKNSLKDLSKVMVSVFQYKDTLWCMSVFSVYFLSHSLSPIQHLKNVRALANALENLIPAQMPARGVGVNRVYRCRTCGSIARLCSKAL